MSMSQHLLDLRTRKALVDRVQCQPLENQDDVQMLQPGDWIFVRRHGSEHPSKMLVYRNEDSGLEIIHGSFTQPTIITSYELNHKGLQVGDGAIVLDHNHKTRAYDGSNQLAYDPRASLWESELGELQ